MIENLYKTRFLEQVTANPQSKIKVLDELNFKLQAENNELRNENAKIKAEDIKVKEKMQN